MKKIIALAFLFHNVTAFAQNETAEDTASKPIITAVGKPVGKKTAFKVTKEGGSLKSSDGLVQLIIPDGAVAKKTNISIEPITNLLTNGNGPAYRFEPSGILFKKPVQVIFHFDEEEIKDSMQLLMGIAMQDNIGQWFGLKNSVLDSIAKTISGNINHFSDWGRYDKIKIDPSYARLKVNKTRSLTITHVASEDDDLIEPLTSGSDDMLSPLIKRKIPWRAVWMANEIVNGNATEGKISVISKTSINYKAPASLPPKNPVAVTADLTGIVFRTKIKGQLTTFEKLRLVSNILIFDDAYEVTMISEIQDPGAGTNLGAATYKDTGSFVISLNGREARIIERVNRNTNADLGYLGGCCWNFKIIKTGTGNIHIAGAPVVKVTPPSAPGKSAIVEVRFNRIPAIFPTFQVTCQCPGDKKPMNFTNAQGIVMMSRFLRADPEYIKFEAKEGEQTILEHGQPGGQVYTKFTVKHIKEDE